MQSSVLARHRQFIELYERSKDRLYSFILFRVGNEADIAEDLVSDVFLKAYADFDAERSETSLAWLFLIAKRRVIDYYRTKKEISPLEPDEYDRLECDEITPEHLFAHESDVKDIESEIAQLSETEQSYLKAYFYEQRTSSEIAALHDTTPAAVRKRLSRTIEKLRTALVSLLFIFLP